MVLISKIRQIQRRVFEKMIIEHGINEASAEMNGIFYGGFNDEEILAFEAGLGKVLENLTKKENGHE